MNDGSGDVNVKLVVVSDMCKWYPWIFEGLHQSVNFVLGLAGV